MRNKPFALKICTFCILFVLIFSGGSCPEIIILDLTYVQTPGTLTYEFTIAYANLSSDNINDELFITITPGPPGYESQDRYVKKIFADDYSGSESVLYTFPTEGTYQVWVKLKAPNNTIKDNSDKYIINVVGGSPPDKRELLLTEAERYRTYTLTWYSRSSEGESDINDPEPRVWTSGIPYSLMNANVLETVVSRINTWKQVGQTRWYQYSPGKVGVNYYDILNYTGQGYPWPTDFQNFWTGVNCTAFLYYCGQKAGYNFTSDDNYRTNTDPWQTLGTQVLDWRDVQRGDIVYLPIDDPDYTGAHIALVTASHMGSRESILLVQAFGKYQSPFNFKVSSATLGQTLLQINPQPEPVFRRLPSQ